MIVPLTDDYAEHLVEVLQSSGCEIVKRELGDLDKLVATAKKYIDISTFMSIITLPPELAGRLTCFENYREDVHVFINAIALVTEPVAVRVFVSGPDEAEKVIRMVRAGAELTVPFDLQGVPAREYLSGRVAGAKVNVLAVQKYVAGRAVFAGYSSENLNVTFMAIEEILVTSLASEALKKMEEAGKGTKSVVIGLMPPGCQSAPPMHV